jgi:hypothetical protein
MSKYASGKRAFGISDRSGFRYRYKDLRREWNGARVHVSEFEPKHPQLEPKPIQPDSQGLRNARPQTFTINSGGGGGIVANLTLPGDFAFGSNNMTPENGSVANNRRQANMLLGEVGVDIT